MFSNTGNMFCKDSDLDELRVLIFALADMLFFIPDVSMGNKGTYFISGENIMSAENTIFSIDYCCSRGFFADAFTLARKYRDDLMQYLFVSSVISNIRGLTEEEFGKSPISELQPDEMFKMLEKEFQILQSGSRKSNMELAVEAWMYGDLEGKEHHKDRKEYFDTSKYKKILQENSCVKEMFTNYLQQTWEETDRILNNYVHANGLKYITANYVQIDQYEKHRNVLLNTMRNITSIFLSMLILIDGRKVQSSDYRDAMECNCQPPEGCQYWIIPVIVEYMDEYFPKLHPDLLEFLCANNPYGMKLKLSDYS